MKSQVNNHSDIVSIYRYGEFHLENFILIVQILRLKIDFNIQSQVDIINNM